MDTDVLKIELLCYSLGKGIPLYCFDSTFRDCNMAGARTKQLSTIAERRFMALEFRKSGLSYRAIGEKLKIDYTQAWRDVRDALKILADKTTEKADEVRQIELERLNDLTKGLEPFAMTGNPSSVMAYLKVMERRAKLLGIDAPDKTLNINVSIELVTQVVTALESAGKDPSEVFNRMMQKIAQDSDA
jgi:hypothetical protein